MSDRAGSGEVIVSVQATGMELKPWAGHRAVGLLATEDLVLVPDSPPELADAAQWFEVLIIPASLQADQPVERIGVTGVEALNRLDDGRVTSVVLSLARWSRHLPMISSFDGCKLKTQVQQTGGNLWTALVNVGAIRPGLDVIADDVLRAVPDLELEQRQRRIRLHPYRSPGDNSWDICPFIKWPCIPCPP